MGEIIHAGGKQRAMRKSVFTLILLGTATLFAADPYVGTWKFNAAKSVSTSTNPPPKEETIVIQEQGDGLSVALTGTAASGTRIVNKFSGKMGGAVNTMKLVESPYEAILVKSIAPNIRDLTYVVGGGEATQHAILSGDGKTLCLVTRSVGAQGATENIQVFDKQ
jgi:hypothetical protein